MHITATPYFKAAMALKGLSASGLARKVNTLQKADGFSKRPMTQQAIYHYLHGYSPTEDRIYAISAILGVKPQKIFAPAVNQERLDHFKNLLSEI